MFIDCLGPGKTILSASLVRKTEDNERGDLYVVLVDLGDEYVVSQMFDSEVSWLQGTYFTDLAKAIAFFATRMRAMHNPRV